MGLSPSWIGVLQGSRIADPGDKGSGTGRGGRGRRCRRRGGSGFRLAARGRFGIARTIERSLPLPGFETIDPFAADDEYRYAQAAGEFLQFGLGLGAGLRILAAERDPALGEQLARLVAGDAAGAG